MKLSPGKLIGALCLIPAAQAFTTQPTAARTVIGVKVATTRPAANTALHVSFIQDRLKEMGDDRKTNNDKSAAWPQQLQLPAVSPREMGLLVLLTVPVAWGTYAPTVQSLYTMDTQIPGFIFSTFYFAVAASGSLAATWLVNQKNNKNGQANKPAAAAEPVLPAVAGLELGLYVYLANFLHVIGLQSVPSDRAGFLFQCK